MCSPATRYFGEHGEISATHRAADSGPDTVTQGTEFHYLAPGASTDGDFGLYRVDMGPGSGGPFAPGAPCEGYFEGLAKLAELTDEERAEFFIRHDSYFV
jgi:hypothetical protein